MSLSVLVPVPVPPPTKSQVYFRPSRLRISVNDQPEIHPPSPWAKAAVGPSGAKRTHCSIHLPNKGLFVDLHKELEQPKPVEWLVEDFLPLNYLIVLGGDSKCGKTW